MKIVTAGVGLALAMLTAGSLSAQIVTYSTRGAFDAAAGPTTTETFNNCGNSTTTLPSNTTLSSSNLGPCSSLQAGISFTPEGQLYIAAPGQSANITTALGVNVPTGGYNEIGFLGGAYAFGADFFQNVGGGEQTGFDQLFTASVFGLGGFLGSFDFNVASGTGSFFGLTSTESITSVRVSQADGFAVIDDVSWSAAAVPEPASWALMLTSLVMMGGMLRVRRQ